MSDNVIQEDSFTGDGTTKKFTLTKDVDRIISVTVGSTATTAYTYADGEITFTNEPANAAAIKVSIMLISNRSLQPDNFLYFLKIWIEARLLEPGLNSRKDKNYG